MSLIPVTNPTAKPSKPKAGTKKLTPAMRQYATFKAQHPDCVLFFRMGDFYECFGEDALTVSSRLGLTIAHRNTDTPMAGVPHQRLDHYLRKAVDAGLRIAVCDQVQDPAQAKGVVARAVTQVVTPGTLTADGLVDDERAAPLAAIADIRENEPGSSVCIALAEVSTGAFTVLDVRADRVADELVRRGVSELLYPEDDVLGDPLWVRDIREKIDLPMTARAAWHFRSAEALEAALAQYKVKSLDGFGFGAGDAAIPVIGAVIYYLRETQGADASPEMGASNSGVITLPNTTLAHLRPPKREDAEGFCTLDATSLRALEVERTIRGGEVEGSLLGVFLRSKEPPRTPMGKRLLRDWLCRPMSMREAIVRRQTCVASLKEDRRAAGELGSALEPVQDVARIAARIALDRASPRDIVALGGSLSQLDAIVRPVEPTAAFGSLVDCLRTIEGEVKRFADLVMSRCVDDPPYRLSEGGLIRDGVDSQLDEARLLQRDAGAWLASYQTELAERHDLPAIKVGYNKVFGYYIELSAAQAQNAPDSFTRKQTLKNAERYITPELKAFEEKVLSADSRAIEREKQLFEGICDEARDRLADIAVFADAAAELDAMLALADKASARGWIKPEITEDSALAIVDGRHPVLDELLEGDFVPNDCALGNLGDASAASLALITGPNMAGKSTYIRQVALITLLAHAGSFVPASSATIGVVDRIFTRVGADDALHRGQSTFMVEMTETANILNSYTPRSLIILDEIGRGTSTLDGLSLAWAIAEDLSGTSGPAPRTLFATHYHEITDLESQRPGRVANLHVQVKEWKPASSKDGRAEIVFLHRVGPGCADQSYGVHVARLAGVPAGVTARADQILASLSVQHNTAPKVEAMPAATQMGLFTEFVEHPALDKIRELKLDELTPLEAFDHLRIIRQSIGEES